VSVTADTSASLESLLASREIIVFCGSGGVGKTTTAAATALEAATRTSGRVLVLTIDPARRLADALGLDGIGNIERRVPEDALRAAGIETSGELWAAMLDTKASWDDLVLRHAPDEETAYRILDNRMYATVTGRFVQSHDYIAMERLYDLHASGRYDVIIVDTPPTRNAIDFLEAPARMAEFFGGRLLRWLTAPYRVGGRRGARLIHFASRPFYQLADRVLGKQFLQDIAEFFLNFQAMYDGFNARAQAVQQLLHERRTGFVVVTTLESSPLREAQFFCHALEEQRFHLDALVLNRVLPSWLCEPSALAAAAQLLDRALPVAEDLVTTGASALSDVERTARVLLAAASMFRDYSALAEQEAQRRDELSSARSVVATVPILDEDVHDIAGLHRIGKELFTT